MKIEILGTGCAKCSQLAANAEAAARELGLDFELTKVTSLTEIASYGVMVTPALAVDGTVKLAGKVSSPSQIKDLLESASRGSGEIRSLAAPDEAAGDQGDGRVS